MRGIVDATRVLHHGDERIGEIDPPVAICGRGNRHLAAILVGAGGAAPRNLHDAIVT